MNEEIWRPVVGYEGLYLISSTGQIVRTKDFRPMKFSVDKDGYFEVGLTKDRKQSWYRVNRLVALTFIPNPDRLPIVHHRDNDKQNNRIENLEWASVSYNTKHAIDTGRLVIDTNRLKNIAKIRGQNLSKAVRCVETEVMWPSIQNCSSDIGLGRDALSRHIYSGKPYKGYTYVFAD